MKKIELHGRVFRESIPYGVIEREIRAMAARINGDFGDKEPPVFVCILNGAFMFAAELLQRIDFDCEVSFVRLASYEGTGSCGSVSQLVGLTGSLEGRHVIVLEDVVETGATLEAVDRIVAAHRPASLSYATLFFKPDSYRAHIKVDYHAMDMPDDFIVGFGLDYNQLGRNLRDIYTIEQ